MDFQERGQAGTLSIQRVESPYSELLLRCYNMAPEFGRVYQGELELTTHALLGIWKILPRLMLQAFPPCNQHLTHLLQTNLLSLDSFFDQLRNFYSKNEGLDQYWIQFQVGLKYRMEPYPLNILLWFAKCKIVWPADLTILERISLEMRAHGTLDIFLQILDLKLSYNMFSPHIYGPLGPKINNLVHCSKDLAPRFLRYN